MFTNDTAAQTAFEQLTPAKRNELQQEAMVRANDTWAFALRALTGAPLPPAEGLNGDADRRFSAGAWSQFPFNVYARATSAA